MITCSIVSAQDWNLNGNCASSNEYKLGTKNSLCPIPIDPKFDFEIIHSDNTMARFENNLIKFAPITTTKVLIGAPSTTTPGDYKLYVEKGIMTEKVKVALKSTSDWADYVFEEDYELMSLKDVEIFIRENKHLPGICSAETLVEEGIDLGAMQAKLLEKIEELTLYLIQKDKEIEELKTQVESLIEQK